MALQASGMGYHGTVTEIKRYAPDSDYMTITISPQGVHNPKDKTYKVMDIFFQTTEDKICNKTVYVKESTTGELLKLLHDYVASNITVPQKPELLFRYDDNVLYTYSHISFAPIKNTLRENIKKHLNTPERRGYMKDLLRKTPNYIAQYGYLEIFTKRLQNNPDYQFTVYDSEYIHFYCAAYDAALCIIKGKFAKNTSQELSTIDTYYTLYQEKVVDEYSIIGYDIFQGYVDIFIHEIIHNQKGHTASIREQRILNMYNLLDPAIKYYFITEPLSLPIDKITYNYLVALYHMQYIYKEYSNVEGFYDTLQELIKLYEATYPYGLPAQKKTNDMLFFDVDLHEHEVFNQDVGVQVLLNEFFDYLMDELYETFESNTANPVMRKVDILEQTIRERLNNDILNVQWFYYCLQILEEIYNTSLANKDDNHI